MKQLPALLIIVFFCFYLGATAQSPVTIEYDLPTNKLTRPKNNIPEGSSIAIRYTGVNKYAMKSSAAMTSGNRSYDDGLAQLQAGLQQLAKDEKKATDASGKAAAAATSPNVPVEFIHIMTLTTFRLSQSKLSIYLENKASILNKISLAFKNIQQEIMKINSTMSMDKDITAAADDPALFTQSKMEAAIFIQTGVTGISAPADFADILTLSVNNIKTYLVDINSLMRELKDNLATADLEAKDLKPQSDELGELTTDIKKQVTDLDATYSGANLKVLQENAADMGRRSLKLLNQDFTIAPTVIGNASGDYIEISDKLTDKAGNQLLEIKPFKIYTSGGSRVDFSIGLSVTIGGQGKFKYDLQKNPTNATSGTAVDSVILKSDDEDRLFKFYPTIFVHWYKTTNCRLQWMFTTGITPNFTDMSDSRLSVGTSIGFPSSSDLTRRVVVSTGLSIGYADILKTKYKGLVDYRSFTNLAATDLTEKALKLGAFFAVSYNLGGTGH